MLTDLECKSAVCPPEKKRARFSDGGGLYLEVSPGGSKRWFWKTYAGGKEGRLALGSYPAMRVAEARKARDAAKVLKASGVDPVEVRKLDKLKGRHQGGATFRAVALEWHAKQVGGWSPEHAKRTVRQLERDLFPDLGERPMAAVEPMELLAVLQKVEERGALETADRALMLARQVYEYWLPTAGKAQRNITEGLKKRLTPLPRQALRRHRRATALCRAAAGDACLQGWPPGAHGAATGPDPVPAACQSAHDGMGRA